jgi:hypothetical protein
MKTRIHIAFICCSAALALLWTPCFAQQSKESSYQAMSDHFFSLLKEGKSSEGVDYLLDTNPFVKKKFPDKVDELKSQFGSLGNLMGNYVSNAKLIETKVADMFVYQHYFVAYDRQPISVRIKYYKPAGKWICYSLQFDADLSDLIQKQADSNLRVDTQY